MEMISTQCPVIWTLTISRARNGALQETIATHSLLEPGWRNATLRLQVAKALLLYSLEVNFTSKDCLYLFISPPTSNIILFTTNRESKMWLDMEHNKFNHSKSTETELKNKEIMPETCYYHFCFRVQSP